jgi:flavodoxin
MGFLLGGSRVSDGGSGFDLGKLMLPAIGVGISVAAMAAAYSMSQGTSKKKKGKKDKGPKVTGPKINVYFGSQTGTAEDMAKSLAKEGIKRNFDMKAIDMERFEPLDAAGTNCIFLVATYGEGDPTDNARSCFDWLQDEGKEGDLDGMTYAVFGLGNTQYEHYNSVGTFFDRLRCPPNPSLTFLKFRASPIPCPAPPMSLSVSSCLSPHLHAPLPAKQPGFVCFILPSFPAPPWDSHAPILVQPMWQARGTARC